MVDELRTVLCSLRNNWEGFELILFPKLPESDLSGRMLVVSILNPWCGQRWSRAGVGVGIWNRRRSPWPLHGRWGGDPLPSRGWNVRWYITNRSELCRDFHFKCHRRRPEERGTLHSCGNYTENLYSLVNLVVYFTSKIASLSPGTSCFKLTVKQGESQHEGSGKGEKQDCPCGRSVFVCVFIGALCGCCWSSLWEADLEQAAGAGSICR